MSTTSVTGEGVTGWVFDVLVGWIVGSIIGGLLFGIVGVVVGARLDVAGVLVGTVLGIIYMRIERTGKAPFGLPSIGRHGGLQFGTAGFRDGGATSEIRGGDILRVRREIPIEGRRTLKEGQRLRADSVADQRGNLWVQNEVGKQWAMSRGHLELVRRAVMPRPGDTWVLATNLQGTDKKTRPLGVKGQNVEVVAAKSGGRVKVVDEEGNFFWVRDMLLDPVEDSRNGIPEPSV